MENNIKHLLISELYSATAYVDRLFTSLGSISDINIDYNSDLSKISHTLDFDITELFETTLLLSNFIKTDSDQARNHKEIKARIKAAHNIIKSLMEFSLEEESITKLTVSFINILYKHCYDLHCFVANITELEINYPRINLIEPCDPDSADMIQRFHLPEDKIFEFRDSSTFPISALECQRQKKYDSLMEKGHLSVFHKKFSEALECFLQAQKFKQTGEVFTITAWTYSNLDDLEKAKAYCLKAIKTDPDYGPPYNDLGSYLLAEGQINESFKWFELAKKAARYENREYPYINAGRAYMAQQKFHSAYEEFEQAKKIAPFHAELHQTIDKLKSLLDKADATNDPNSTTTNL